MSDALPAWHGDPAALRAIQDDLARQVVLRDAFPKPLRTVAGFDVGFEDDGATTRAAAVLLDADTLEVLDQQVARSPTRAASSSSPATAIPCPASSPRCATATPR